MDAMNYIQADPLVRAHMLPEIQRYGMHFKFLFSLRTRPDINLQRRMGTDDYYRLVANKGREVRETPYDLLTAYKPHPLLPLQNITLKICELREWSCYALAQLVMVGYHGVVMTDTTAANFEAGYTAACFEGLVDGNLAAMFQEQPHGVTMLHLDHDDLGYLRFTVASKDWQQVAKDLIDLFKALIDFGILLKYQKPNLAGERRQSFGMDVIYLKTWEFLIGEKAMPNLAAPGRAKLAKFFMRNNGFNFDDFEAQKIAEISGRW